MMGPTEDFSGLPFVTADPAEYWGRIPDEATFDAYCDELLGERGISRSRPSLRGSHLAVRVPCHESFVEISLKRTKLYSIATPRELAGAIRAHIDLIAARHGEGAAWFLGCPVHLVYDDSVAPRAFFVDASAAFIDAGENRDLVELQAAARADHDARPVLADYWENRGRLDLASILRREPHLLLRTFYAHAAQAVDAANLRDFGAADPREYRECVRLVQVAAAPRTP